MEVQIKKITDRISYIPAMEEPYLSADCVIIEGDRCTYVFDPGSCPDNIDVFLASGKPLKVIVSHFHEDHIGILTYESTRDRIPAETVYASRQSAKYITAHPCTVVEEPVEIEDGVSLRIVPLPASHAKGCLMLIVNGEYLFLGDATYPMKKKGEIVYNAGLLKEELALLKSLDIKKAALSHDRLFIRPLAVSIRQLESVYSKRDGNNPYICVSSPGD